MSKRRRFTSEFKARIVLEELIGIKDRAEICREQRLNSQRTINEEAVGLSEYRD